MEYLVFRKTDMANLVPKSFGSPKDAEKALRLADPDTYMIVRVVADDVVVEEPPPTSQPANRVVIGKRTFTRKPKVQPSILDE